MKICIASDVQNNYMLLASDDKLFSITCLAKLMLKEEQFETSINSGSLRAIIDEVKSVISIAVDKRKFLEKATRPTPTYSIGIFENKPLMLNPRDESDFEILTLLTFLNLCESTTNSNGSLYLFNKTLVDFYCCGNILALLKGSVQKKTNEIWDEMISLEKKFDIAIVHNTDDFNMGIKMLLKYGVICGDSEEGYSVTARGHMVVI